MSKQVVRKKGFSFLAFFLGFLFGIIFIVGSIVGVGAFVLYADIDTVFNVAGMKNTDEEGNYIYINTDVDNGGVKNVMELFGKISSVVGGDASIGEVENLVPAVSGLVDEVCDIAAEYIDLDRQALREKPFGELVNFFSETVLDIQPAVLMSKFGMDGVFEDGLIGEMLSIVLKGSEADYVEVNGSMLPVYKEILDGGERYIYKLDDVYYNVNKTDDGYTATNTVCSSVDEEWVVLSGNFYYDGENKINENPVTLRTLTSGNAFSGLDSIMLTDILNSEDGGIVYSILGGVSLGQMLSGEVNFDEKINNLEIGPLLGDVSAESAIVAYIAYGITDIENNNGNYTAVYHDNGKEIPVVLTVEGGNIISVYDEDGENVKGTTVNGITPRIDGVMNDLKLNEILGESDSKLINTLGQYTINEVGSRIEHIPFGDFIEIDQSSPKVLQLLQDKTITDMNNGSFINNWYLKDIIETDGNDILEKLGEKTLGELQSGDFLDDFALDDFIDVEIILNDKNTPVPSTNILAYLVYGITDIAYSPESNSYSAKYLPENATEKQDVILTVSEGIITVVATQDGTTIKGALFNEVSPRINGLMDVLTIGQLTGETEGIFGALKDSTVNTIAEDIKNVPLGEIFSPTEGDGILWALRDATISNMSDKINELTLGEIIDVEEEGSAQILKSLKDTPISELSSKINSLTLEEIISVKEGDGILWALRGETLETLPYAVNELTLGQVIEIDENDPSTAKILITLKNKKISELGTEINNLTLGEVIEVDESSKILTLLKDEKINNIGNAINNLKVNKLFEDDIYEKDDSGNFVVDQTTGERKVQGIWHFMLWNEDEGAYGEYTINDMSKMVTNVATNVSSSTLYKLQETGIIEIDKEKLDKKVMYYNTSYNPSDPNSSPFIVSNQTIGDMSLEDFITFVADNMAAT